MTAKLVRSHSAQPPWLLGLFACSVLLAAGVGSSRAVEYQWYQLLDDRRAYDVAMLDDNNVVVTATIPAPPYAHVITRMLWNHVLTSPVILDEQAPPDAQPVLAACSRGFFLAYASGSHVHVRLGNGLSWGEDLQIGTGSTGKSDVRLAVDPHGTAYLLYAMGADTWWSKNPPETNQWTPPQLAWAGQTSGELEFKQLSGVWQPRIYGVSWTSYENLVYRQFDGTGWQSPVTVIGSYGSQYGRLRVGHRADGRHFLACGLGFHAVATFEENLAGSFLPAGTRMNNYGSECTESMNFTPANFDLASSVDGTIHLFRGQEAWRVQDGDLYLCAAGLYWEQCPTDGSWDVPMPGLFSGIGFIIESPLFVCLPADGVGPPAFSWYNNWTRVMVPNYVAGADQPPASLAARLEVTPNPSSGPVRVRWTGPAAAFDRRIEVFSVEGRLVRTLTLADGRNASWDLQDAAGRPVDSGIYLVRTPMGNGAAAARRMVVLR